MENIPSIFAFVKELDAFTYELSVSDHVWNILFPDEDEKWHHIHVNKYKRTFYINHISGDAGYLEVELNRGIRAFAS